MPLLELSFASGEDSLSVRRFAVRESLSSLFEVSVRAQSPSEDIDLASLVGKPAALRVQGDLTQARRGMRVFSGVCSYMEQEQAEETGLWAYHLRIVPSLWLLSQRSNYRIFPNSSVPEIAASLLDEWGIERIARIDRGRHPKLEYRVQYGETDLAFLCRLLEEAGISFLFSDEDGKESKLVLADRPHAGDARAGGPIPFIDKPDRVDEREFVTRVKVAHEVRQRLASERAEGKTVTFLTNAIDLRPGVIFSIAHHARADLGPENMLLVTELSFEGAHEGTWMMTARAVPASEPYHPARKTPKPRVQGLRSAIVVGPEGREIFTDELGRVKVQFPWDREGAFDHRSSCWMRVGQAWAGGSYAMVALPRVGQEVLVGFFEGDPDQPVIVGRVDNNPEAVVKKRGEDDLDGALPVEVPPGVDLDEHVEMAEDRKWHDPADARWFEEMTAEGGRWDFRRKGSQYEDFASFHFGLVGKAMGFPEGVLLRRAGKATEAKRGSDPSRGDPGNGLWGGTEPYGNDPRSYAMIKKGFEYYDRRYK